MFAASSLVIIVAFFCRESSSRQDILSSLSRDADDVQFLLFKDPNNMDSYKEIEYGNADSLLNSGFDKNADAVTFVIHGFMASVFGLAYPRVVVQAYLEKKPHGNYIAVDWSKLGNPKLAALDVTFYPIAAANTKIVGKRVGQFIQFLIENKMLSSSAKVHIIGHSLGGHVSGNAGKFVKQRKLPLVRRITALDIAGPGFEAVPPEDQLNTEDALFVDTIHTSSSMGTLKHIGHVSFFPNGGTSQPFCEKDTIGICAHNIVGEYFAASIRNSSIMGCKCKEDTNALCEAYDCSVQEVFGEYTPETARGLYYVNIARKPADKWRVMKWKNGTVLMSVNQVEDKEAKVVGPNDSLRMTET